MSAPSLPGRVARGLLGVGRGTEVHRVRMGPGVGLELELPPDTPVDLYLGVFEWEVASYVRAFCRPGYRALDAGGHVGWYGLLMARLTGAPVLVFEGDAEACARIERNLARNPAEGALVDVRNALLTDRPGDGGSEVSIDEVAAAEGFVPDVIKVDVDGGETAVLAGAERVLRERRPHLFVETHSIELERDCGDLLLRHGYAPRVVTQRSHLRQGRVRPHNRWLVARGREAG